MLDDCTKVKPENNCMTLQVVECAKWYPSIEHCENSAELNPVITEEIRFPQNAGRLYWNKLIIVVRICEDHM